MNIPLMHNFLTASTFSAVFHLPPASLITFSLNTSRVADHKEAPYTPFFTTSSTVSPTVQSYLLDETISIPKGRELLYRGAKCGRCVSFFHPLYIRLYLTERSLASSAELETDALRRSIRMSRAVRQSIFSSNGYDGKHFFFQSSATPTIAVEIHPCKNTGSLMSGVLRIVPFCVVPAYGWHETTSVTAAVSAVNFTLYRYLASLKNSFYVINNVY